MNYLDLVLQGQKQPDPKQALLQLKQMMAHKLSLQKVTLVSTFDMGYTKRRI